MFDAVIVDAKKKKCKLPVPSEKLIKITNQNKNFFDEVKIPVLNHFDMWDGNIIVAKNEKNFVIKGVIDGERAFYGDSLCDLVSSVSIFGDITKEYAFLKGFTKLDYTKISFTKSETTRLYSYKLYLYLIMFVEMSYRNYGGFLYTCFISNKIKQVYRKLTRLNI